MWHRYQHKGTGSRKEMVTAMIDFSYRIFCFVLYRLTERSIENRQSIAANIFCQDQDRQMEPEDNHFIQTKRMKRETVIGGIKGVKEKRFNTSDR